MSKEKRNSIDKNGNIRLCLRFDNFILSSRLEGLITELDSNKRIYYEFIHNREFQIQNLVVEKINNEYKFIISDSLYKILHAMPFNEYKEFDYEKDKKVILYKKIKS